MKFIRNIRTLARLTDELMAATNVKLVVKKTIQSLWCII